MAAAASSETQGREEEEEEEDNNINDDATNVMQRVPSYDIAVLAGPTANLCSATLGAGILALPAALSKAGLLAGTALLTISAAATIMSIRLLTAAVQKYRCDSYESVSFRLFGRHARTAVEVCIVVFCQGCAVAYLIAVADILEQAGLLWKDNRSLTLTAVWCATCLPLCLLRTMTALQHASVVGIAAICTLLFAATVHLFQDVVEGHDHYHNGNATNNNHTNVTLVYDWFFLDDNDNSTTNSNTTNTTDYDDDDGILWPLNGWSSVWQAFPVILFAFSCQVNVCAIFLELPVLAINGSVHNEMTMARQASTASSNNRNSTRNNNKAILYHETKVPLMNAVAVRAVLLCTALYAAVATVTWADFGAAALSSNILKMYDLRHVPLMQVAAACMAVAVVMAFPLNIFPARVTCRGLPCVAQSTMAAASIRRRGANTVTSSSNIANADLTAALLQDAQEQQEEEEQIAEQSATPPNIMEEGQQQQQVVGESRTEEVDLAVESSRSVFENEYDNGEDDEIDDLQDCMGHVGWTLLLAGSALGLALVVPDISTVFSVLGGTTSSWLGFCVPGLLGLRLERDAHPDERSWLRWLCSWVLLSGGIGVGILTTISTIQSL